MDLDFLTDGGTGHMVPNDDTIAFWKEVHEKTKFKRFMEIGFNAGHSSSILLTLFEDISLVSYDICLYEISVPNSMVVKQRFGDRFTFVPMSSMDILPEDINGKHDILFIDGSHELPFVESDVNLFLTSDIPYVIIDDLQKKVIRDTFEKYKDRLEVIIETTYTASTGIKIPIKCCKRR